MATFDYTEMLDVADELMDEFGQAATLYVAGTKSGDAWNPTLASDTTYSCTIVEILYHQNQINGTTVLATDKRVLIKAGDLSPTILAGARKLTYGGVTYTIVGPVIAYNPGGLNLLWEAQARV